MNINLNGDAMTAILAKSVMESISPEQRELIITQAVASLLTDGERDTYGRQKKSKIEQLFEGAAMEVARDVVREELKKPERKQFIQEMIVAAFDKMEQDTSRRDIAIGRMADALTEALCSKEYR